jgi:molybdopterin-guanine dinucleotide biosynthesis protein B
MSSPRSTPVFGICGWKKSGKTTLASGLIAELTRRGYRVASVKHAHHDFQVDNEDTDSARHRRSGAREVAVVGGKRWAIVHELGGDPEPTLDEILARLSPADLVLVEGYKRAAIPKIEARRKAQPDRRPLASGDPMIKAIAADHEVDGASLPVFSLDDIAAIADFVEREVLPSDRHNGDRASR